MALIWLITGRGRKGERQKLIQTAEVLDFVLSTSRCHHSIESFQRQIRHDLSEYQLSGMRDQPRQITSDNDDSSKKSDSNRGHAVKRIYPLISIDYRRSFVKCWDSNEVL